MKTLKQIAGLFLLAALSYAQPPAKPAPQLSEEVKTNLLSKYKSVLLAQSKVQEKVNAFNAEYNKALAGLPKGSSIAVNPDVDAVDVTLPVSKKEEAKPAEPAKK